MKKNEFANNLRDFKLETVGAACFIDPVTNDKFCANGLSKPQAEAFAAKHHLTLLNWNAGLSCSKVNC